MKTAIVIGVGPDRGLGAQLCKRFAGEGLKVIVAGRTSSAIEAIANDIASAGGEAVPVVADATSEADIVALLNSAGPELDLAIYNAGNNAPGRIIEMDSYFEQSWRVVCFGGSFRLSPWRQHRAGLFRRTRLYQHGCQRMQCALHLLTIGVTQRRLSRLIQHPVQFLQIHIHTRSGGLHRYCPSNSRKRGVNG